VCTLNEKQRMYFIQEVNDKIRNCSQQVTPLDSLLEVAKTDVNELIRDLVSLVVVLLDLYNNQFSVNFLLEKWNKLSNIIKALPYSKKDIRAMLGDARCLNIDSNAVDLIITSPPYINVFNYHQKYRRSVESLGYDVLKIAKKEIGANRKNRGNRYLTVVEYCIDMAYAIKEMMRISKQNARIILVVGRESNVLATAFSNSELIYEVACNIHGLPLVLKQQRAFKNRFGQMIYEDILHFSNSSVGSKTVSDETLVELSRQVAAEALRERMSIFDDSNKNFPLLKAAISNSKSIKASEGR